MYVLFQLSARPSPAHCIWRPECKAMSSPPSMSAVYKISCPTAQAPRVRPAESQGKTLIPVLKAFVVTSVHVEGPAKHWQSLWTSKENFLLTSFSAYFQMGKKKIDVLSSSATQNWNCIPVASVFSPFCASLTGWLVPAASLHDILPPPPKSDRTGQSWLRSWVCHEHSKLPFSAQNALEHMNALTVFSPNKLFGAQLGNCSTA